jgi:hypothetical protein
MLKRVAFYAGHECLNVSVTALGGDWPAFLAYINMPRYAIAHTDLASSKLPTMIGR